MIFLVLLGKIMFLFPKNMILHLRRKMKDDLYQKKHTKIRNFLQTFWKDGLFKKGGAGTWSFLYYLERWYFSQKRDIFSLGRKPEMIFSVYTYGCYKRGVTPLRQKKSKVVLSCKMHLKVIDVLDWHPWKTSSNSLHFHGDLYWCFHVFFMYEKNQET